MSLNDNSQETGGLTTLVATSPNGKECRHSDGTQVWPGYAENMQLKQGYWFGDFRSHVLIKEATTKAEAINTLRDWWG